MTATLPRGLMSEQVRQFHQDGYLVAEDLFASPMLDADEPFTTRLARITAESKEIFRKLQDGALVVNSSGALMLPSIFELMRYEPLQVIWSRTATSH